jgi:hypothetical protein
LERIDLILERITDGPDEEPRYVFIYIRVLCAECGDGDCHRRLHRTQTL